MVQLFTALAIKICLQNAKDLVQMSSGLSGLSSVIDVGLLIQTLTEMTRIFATCRVQRTSEDVENVPKPLRIHLTDAEESWMRLKFSQIQTEFMSVIPSR